MAIKCDMETLAIIAPLMQNDRIDFYSKQEVEK